MIRKSFVLSTATFAIAVLGAGASFAQEATSDAWMQAATSKSRTQVVAELQQARRDGSIRATSLAYIEPLRTSADRKSVHAETMAALRNGAQAAIDAEAHAFAQPRGVVAPTLLAGH